MQPANPDTIQNEVGSDNLIKPKNGISRRELFKIGFGLGAGVLAASLDVSKTFATQLPSVDEGDTEILRLPYSMEVEDMGRHSSLNRMRLDELSIDIQEMLGATFTKIDEYNYKYLPLANFDFVSSEACNKLVEILNLTPERIGLDITQEQIAITLQDIFEDVRHGLIRSVNNRCRKFEMKAFKDGIAKKPEDYPELPMTAVGEPLIGIILGTKLLADVLIHESSAITEVLQDNISFEVLTSTFINLIRNDITSEGINNIEVNYLTSNSAYRLNEDLEENDQRQIPEDARRFITTYNNRMDPVNRYTVSSSLSQSVLNFLTLDNSQTASEMSEINTIIRDKTSFESLINQMQTSLRTAPELGIDVPDELINFVNNLNDCVPRFPNSTEQFEMIYQNLSNSDKAAFIFLRSLQNATNTFVHSIILPEIQDPSAEIYGSRINQLFTLNDVNLPASIFPIIELLGLQSLDALVAPESYDSAFYREFDTATTAQFYTLRNMWLAVRNFVEMGEPDFPETPGHLSNDARKITNFYQSYEEFILRSYDSSADSNLQDKIHEVTRIIQGLAHIYNLQEVKKFSFVSDNYLPNFGGIAFVEEKEIQTRFRIANLSYDYENTFHELRHLYDSRLGAYLVAKEERGIQPRESIYRWSLSHTITATFNHEYGQEELDTVVDEHDPWNGYRSTLQNLNEIKSLFEALELDLPEGLNRADTLDELYTRFKIIEENELLGTHDTLQLTRIGQEDRERLKHHLIVFFNEWYEQEVQHQFQGNKNQNISKLSNADSSWVDSLLPSEKIHLANQLSDQLMLLHGSSFSQMDVFTKQMLFRYRGEMSIDQIIAILFEEHYKYTEYRNFSPVDLAYKTALFNLQFNNNGQFVGVGVNATYIQDWENDMRVFFESERISEQGKEAMLDKFIEYMRLMSIGDPINKLDKVLSYITNGQFIDSTIGLTGLRNRLNRQNFTSAKF
jgi:hypothetical protein